MADGCTLHTAHVDRHQVQYILEMEQEEEEEEEEEERKKEFCFSQ